MSASVTPRVRFSALTFLAIATFAAACSGVSPAEHSPRNPKTSQNPAPNLDAGAPPTNPDVADAAPPPEEIVRGRTKLGALVQTNLPTSVEPLPADRAALLVVAGADERESFVRWIDEAGHLGPVLRLRDEYVVTAYSRADGKRDFVTSDGEQVCIARFALDRSDPETRACEMLAAKAVAVGHQKLALIALEENKVKVEKAVVDVPVRKAKPAPSKAKAKKKTPAKPSGSKKPAATKKKPATTKKKNPDKKPKVEKKVEIVRRDVEVFAQWATSDGFSEIKKTGLKFAPPLDGMTIVDAQAINEGILVSYFDKAKPSLNAPKPPPSKLPPALGWAAIRAGVIDENGVFDEKSKKLIVEGEYDWGFLRGFFFPRFVETNNGPALLTLKGARGGSCEMTRIADAWTLFTPPSVCGIDPRVGPNGNAKGLDTILQAGPKRRPGQPKYDAELVAWAGDTAYFVTNEGRTLNSAKRDGSLHQEPPPFLAQRVRMTQSEILRDGSGFAVVDGQTYRIDAAGDVITDDQPGKTILSAMGFDGAWSDALTVVRPGYKVIPRATGGVIVVGVSTLNDENIVAMTFGAQGQVGVAAATSLHVASGEFDFLAAARPGGGIWVSDSERKRVIWLDDEVHEVASAAWPDGQSDAICVDGLPGKSFVPSITPGQFVEVPALAAPGICVIGQPTWAMDGSLRWFGTYRHDLDILPEVRILRDLEKPITSAASSVGPPIVPPGKTKLRCPPEMVLVDGKLCVDRFEATIYDSETGQKAAPDFPVTPNLFEIAIGDWATARSRVGGIFARAFPLPFLPEWQRGKKIVERAVPLPHVRPNGYITGLIAESACTNAGKRLCTLAEFVLACRGEDDQQFPYGDTYVDGLCNVNRDAHPAATLHDNASIGHLDPRLNRVRVNGSTLLRETGTSLECRSRWGTDAIYDMVGNLDEWIDEGSGAFAGGFYSRSTRSGCDAVITAHPKNYLDYSTGVRCCKDASK